IFKDDCKINWNQPAEKIYNLIRGLSPYPTAFTTLNDKILKVFTAEYEVTETNRQPGEFLSDNKTYLKFTATDGFVSLMDIQLEGKKRMGVEEFLRGVRL
ncbi:MAG TPA: methionyl-tRNA formyltransferase, partial [Mucilaginibacter sp.]|nr:methionyl-tRNA formyltransferase [Mucilaginibacter sp.]